MLDLPSIGTEVAKRRKERGLRQADLARAAGVSRATIDALENGRRGELGFGKLTQILAAVGLAFSLTGAATRRPTLDELMQEAERDQGLGRRS